MPMVSSLSLLEHVDMLIQRAADEARASGLHHIYADFPGQIGCSADMHRRESNGRYGRVTVEGGAEGADASVPLRNEYDLSVQLAETSRTLHEALCHYAVTSQPYDEDILAGLPTLTGNAFYSYHLLRVEAGNRWVSTPSLEHILVRDLLLERILPMPDLSRVDEVVAEGTPLQRYMGHLQSMVGAFTGKPQKLDTPAVAMYAYMIMERMQQSPQQGDALKLDALCGMHPLSIRRERATVLAKMMMDHSLQAELDIQPSEGQHMQVQAARALCEYLAVVKWLADAKTFPGLLHDLERNPQNWEKHIFLQQMLGETVDLNDQTSGSSAQAIQQRAVAFMNPKLEDRYPGMTSVSELIDFLDEPFSASASARNTQILYHGANTVVSMRSQVLAFSRNVLRLPEAAMDFLTLQYTLANANYDFNRIRAGTAHPLNQVVSSVGDCLGLDGVRWREGIAHALDPDILHLSFLPFRYGTRNGKEVMITGAQTVIGRVITMVVQDESTGKPALYIDGLSTNPLLRHVVHPACWEAFVVDGCLSLAKALELPQVMMNVRHPPQSPYAQALVCASSQHPKAVHASPYERMVFNKGKSKRERHLVYKPLQPDALLVRIRKRNPSSEPIFLEGAHLTSNPRDVFSDSRISLNDDEKRRLACGEGPFYAFRIPVD